MSFYSKAQRAWQKVKGFRCPYIAMMEAAEAGRGLNLSAADVRYMVQDDALATVAGNHAEEASAALKDHRKAQA